MYAFLNLTMNLSRSWSVFILSFLIASGILHLAEAADGVNEFRRCYNTSVETHCFDLQFDTINNRWLTASFETARQRCISLNSTLPIIKDEETNDILKNYISDPSNLVRYRDIWTDAYRISDYNNSYTWHWVNSKLPNIPTSDVGWTCDISCYTTTLEFRSDNGKPQFYLTAKQPYSTFSYLCEYSAVSSCNNRSNTFQFQDRCYISFSASVSWYDARNKCLKDGGDLASFGNVTNINFTSWLGSDPYVRYWIGLRFTWYIWKDSGDDVKFTKWVLGSVWSAQCLVTNYNYAQTLLNWLPQDCITADQTNVVCHSVTPLSSTTLTTASATTLPVTTSAAGITTQTETTQLNDTTSKSAESERNSAGVAIGVGVGVGVGVPVIVAIGVIVFCVARRHQSKKPESSTVKQDEETLPPDVHADTSEGEVINHYATIRSVSPPQPSAVENDSTTHETEYAKLDFNESADSKNNNGHIPLDVL